MVTNMTGMTGVSGKTGPMTLSDERLLFAHETSEIRRLERVLQGGYREDGPAVDEMRARDGWTIAYEITYHKNIADMAEARIARLEAEEGARIAALDPHVPLNALLLLERRARCLSSDEVGPLVATIREALTGEQ